MKNLFNRRFVIPLMCIGSTSFFALPGAAQSLWNAQTFGSGGVRGFMTQGGDISDASMAGLAASGANVVRFFVELSLNTGNNSNATAYTYNSAGLQSIVASANKYGFKVIICLDDPNSTYVDSAIWANTSQGNSLRYSVASIWQTIASQYNGNATIAAYELFNEPVVINNAYSTAGQNQWVSVASSWINAIRSIDPNHTIIFEPSPWALPDAYSVSLTAPLPFSNIVYSYHDYAPRQIVAQGEVGQPLSSSEVYPTYGDPYAECNSGTCWALAATDSSNLITQKNLSGLIAFQHQFNVPVFIGEFGCVQYAPIAPSNGRPSCYNYDADTIALYESYGWSWTFSAWRGYWGWDPTMPEAFFYQFPYVNALPQVTYGGYNSALVQGDVNYNYIGFAPYRSNMTDTFVLLEQSFTSNYALTPNGTQVSGLQNAGFEGPYISNFIYDPAGAYWSFSGNSGIQRNGSDWGATNAPNGAQTAFLQNHGGNGSISQTFYLAQSGNYSVSFQSALRSYQTASTTMSFQVALDGNVLGGYQPYSTYFQASTTGSIYLNTGYHTLSFVGTAPGSDTADFIDSVVLNYLGEPAY